MSETGEPITFPDMQGILSMNINIEKLENVMRFILDMLNKHELELQKGNRKTKEEVVNVKALSEDFEKRFENIEHILSTNKGQIQELRKTQDSRENDLNFALKAIDEHSSALLKSNELVNDILKKKQQIDQSIEDLRKRIRMLREMDHSLLDRSIVQGVEKSREHFPRYTGKQFYVSNEKRPTGIFRQSSEKTDSNEDKPVLSEAGNVTQPTLLDPNTLTPSQESSISNFNQIKNTEKQQFENVEISEDSSVSSEFQKKRYSSRTPPPMERLRNEKNFLPYLNQPSHSSQFLDLISRIEVIEKYLERPEEKLETKRRIGKLESMYRFIEGILDTCEPLTLKNRDQIMHLVRNIKTLESEMTNKLNTEEFDMVKNMVVNLSKGSPKQDQSQSIPSQELNRIRLLEKRMTELETNVSDLVKVYPENIEEVVLKLRRLDQMVKIKISEEDLAPLKEALDGVKEKLKKLKTTGKKTKDKPKKIEKSVESSVLTSINRRISGVEEMVRSLKIPSGLNLTQLWEEILKANQNTQVLKSIIDDYKKQDVSRKNEILQKIEKKIDIEEIKSLEDALTKQIQILNEKSSHFASRKELKRVLNLVEELSKQEPVKSNPDGDDALLAKKPLGGWSCASCEKKLEKLSGKLPSHTSWKKLPFRDASERMLKAGLGYSKMLTSLQLESIRNKNEEDSISSFRNMDRSHSPFL